MNQNDDPYVSFETRRVLAAIASFSIIFKAFDWMRLFEGTGFYILLVELTIREIMSFMIVLLFSWIVFGMPIGFLDMNRTRDTSLIDGIFGSWTGDIIFNQYLLSLGEFRMDNY